MSVFISYAFYPLILRHSASSVDDMPTDKYFKYVTCIETVSQNIALVHFLLIEVVTGVFVM
jgi:hypothetical protein